MAWATFTKQDVIDRLREAEAEAYEEDKGGATNLDGIVKSVVALVLGKVRKCRDNLNKLGPSGTIPEECVFAAATIARNALLATYPLDEVESKLRAEELRKAYEYLDSVAACDVLIEDGSGGVPEAGASSGGCYGGNPLLDF